MITEEEAAKDLRSLCETAQRAHVFDLCSRVLYDPRFFEAPGGSEHHHNYKHGLVRHTREVMANVSAMTYGKPSATLVTAVVWHDFNKVREYYIDSEGVVKRTPYRKLVGHVGGSAIAFNEYAKNVSENFIEDVLHLMLSHHGRKEWGSPVEPATAEAFILHAADMMSSLGCNI